MATLRVRPTTQVATESSRERKIVAAIAPSKASKGGMVDGSNTEDDCSGEGGLADASFFIGFNRAVTSERPVRFSLNGQRGSWTLGSEPCVDSHPSMGQ